MIALQWRPRALPLMPAVVGARGEAARQLAWRVLDEFARRDGLELKWQGVAGADFLLILAPAEELPWCDGAVYFGRDAGLLLPCAAEPYLPAELLARALAKRFPDVVGPILVWPDAKTRVISLAAAQTLERARVEEFSSAFGL